MVRVILLENFYLTEGRQWYYNLVNLLLLFQIFREQSFIAFNNTAFITDVRQP